MNSELIFGQENWRHFQECLTNDKEVFIHADLTSGDKVFLPTYESWFLLKTFCESNDCFISKIYLQFRSHIVDIDIPNNVDAVYLVKSITGWVGGATKKCLSVGTVKGKTVRTQKWTTPELTAGRVSHSTKDKCFTKAMINNVKKAKPQK